MKEFCSYLKPSNHNDFQLLTGGIDWIQIQSNAKELIDALYPNVEADRFEIFESKHRLTNECNNTEK